MKRSKSKKGKPSRLFSELEGWRSEWKDMPDFHQEDLQPKRSIIVHFYSKKDRNKFAKLVKQTITDSTKSISYPAVKRMKLINRVCTDES
jgi:hypothetical protein